MSISKVIIDGTSIDIKQVYEMLGISLSRFTELLDRDFYVPTMESAPTAETRSYSDTDGSVCEFRVGQMCRVADIASYTGYRFYLLHDINADKAVWDLVDGEAMRLAMQVNEELEKVEEMIYSLSAETFSFGFARENGSADPDAEIHFGTDEMYEKLTGHIHLGVFKNGELVKQCKDGYLTVATDDTEIAIDGTMGDVGLFTDVPIFKLCETMEIAGREMNVMAFALQPFSWYDRKAKRINPFALAPDGTVNAKVGDDVRSQAHTIYNTAVAGTYNAPTAIFKASYKTSGGGYPSQSSSCVQSIQYAQNKNTNSTDGRPYMSGYYEFYEILVGLMLSRLGSTNHTTLTDFGVGSTMMDVVNASTFNDAAMSGNAGMKILTSSGAASYTGLMSQPFKLNASSSTVYTLSAIAGSSYYGFVSILEAQRLLDGISRAGLTSFIGSNTNVFTMDASGNVTVITDGSVNLDDGTGMTATQHYYVVRNVPKFKGIADGQMTAVVNSYTKLEFADGVVNASNADLTGGIGILKRSIPLFMGWALPIHGYFVQSDGAFYICKVASDGTENYEFRSASSVDAIPPRTAFGYEAAIDSQADIEKGLDNVIPISYGANSGWAKKSNYSASLFCHTLTGGGSRSYESAHLWVVYHKPSAGKRQVHGSVLGCNANDSFASVRSAHCSPRAGYSVDYYVGSWSLPSLNLNKTESSNV